MQKKLVFCMSIACIYFTAPLVLYGMNSDNFSCGIESLPKELREYILLSPDIGFFKDTINFLGSQPITLKHTTYAGNLKVRTYDNKVETKSQNSMFSEWHKKVWDIHTGQYIQKLKKSTQPWEPRNNLAVISGDKAISIYYYRPSDSKPYLEYRETDLWDINTRKKLDRINHKSDVLSLASDDNNMAIGLRNGQVKICNGTTLFLLKQYEFSVTALAIKDGILAVGLGNGFLETINIHTKAALCLFKNNTAKISSILINDNKIFTGSYYGITKVWNIDTGELLHTLTGPNRHRSIISSIALTGDAVVTGSYDDTAKIWPLKINLQGTSEENPLLWIICNANIPQLDFIKRAYEATQAEQEFIISLPKRLGKIKADESCEQMYGRIYFTLPQSIRQYLRNRLTIRRAAKTVIEKTYLAYKEDNCSVM